MSENRELVPFDVIGESIIPGVFDDSRKHMYLSLRASGLSVKESREMADVASQTLKNWRHTDKNVKYWDGPGLLQLRGKYRNQMLYEAYSRNYRMVLEDHLAILTKPPEKLSDDERKTRTKIGNKYGPEGLKAFKELVESGQESGRGLKDLAKLLGITESNAVEGEFNEVGGE